MDTKNRGNSTRPRLKPAKSPRRRPARKPKLPDLAPIFDAFTEAFDLIRAAHMALREADQFGPPEVALTKGIEAMKAVYSDLDGATTDLVRLQRKQAKAAGRRR
jgi:hypothetical protein